MFEREPHDENPSDPIAPWILLGLAIGVPSGESLSTERTINQPVRMVEQASSKLQSHLDYLIGGEDSLVESSLPPALALAAGKGLDLSEPQITRREMLGLMGGFTAGLVGGNYLAAESSAQLQRYELSAAIKNQVDSIGNKLGVLLDHQPFTKDNALVILTGGARDSTLNHYDWWEPFEKRWSIKNGLTPEEAYERHSQFYNEIHTASQALTPRDQEVEYYQALWKEGVFLMPWWLVDDYDCVGMTVLTAALLRNLSPETTVTLTSHSMGAVSTRMLLNFMQKGYLDGVVDPQKIDRAVLVGDPYLGNEYYKNHTTVEAWDEFVKGAFDTEKNILHAIYPHFQGVEKLFRSNDIQIMLHRMLSLHPELIQSFEAGDLPFPVVSVADEDDVFTRYSPIPGSREMVLRNNGEFYIGGARDEVGFDVIPDQFQFITSNEAQEAHKRLPNAEESEVILSLKN